jgi:hypothetical protein
MLSEMPRSTSETSGCWRTAPTIGRRSRGSFLISAELSPVITAEES